MSESFAGVDVPRPVVQLLFLRELWGLRVAPEVPPVLDAPVAASSPGQVEDLRRAWIDVWERNLVALARGGRPTQWITEHADEGFDPFVMNDWVRGHVERITRLEIDAVACGVPTPELRLGLADTVRVVHVLPVTGTYARRLASDVVLVGESTRADLDMYRRALAT